MSTIKVGEIQIIRTPIYKKFIGHACVKCGKVRAVSPNWITSKKFTGLCSDCNKRVNRRNYGHGTTAGHWKGGFKHHPNGYLFRYVAPDHPLFDMANMASIRGFGGYISEHRFVMATHLGRCLKPEEVVHHINGNKKDNGIENLELLPNKASHVPYNLLQNQVRELKEVNEKLAIENKELKEKLKSMKDNYIETGGILNDSSEDTQI